MIHIAGIWQKWLTLSRRCCLIMQICYAARCLWKAVSKYLLPENLWRAVLCNAHHPRLAWPPIKAAQNRGRRTFRSSKAGQADVRRGLKTTCSRVIETVLTNMAERGGLHKVFGRSINFWIQLKIFLSVFTDPLLSSSLFKRPIANFLRKQFNKTVDDWL